jgi:CheY-like chemotaxis protein
VELRAEIPDRPVTVDGDPTRLMQIVGNLLHNAVKFSSRGSRVTLALAAGARPGTVDVRVRDEGAGIEPALLEHVFEPFVQGERTLARSHGGLGLGLALVKALTEMHGGAVAADSAGPGHGAEFRVTLPVAAAEVTRAARDPAEAPRPGRRAVHVLVVEDNPDVAESLRDLVEAFGHEVEVARTGDAAVATARRHPPDVVLCDIGLPGMSGYEVARVFRQDPELRHARLVAVSGYAQAEDRREAAEAGFDRHVGKPPDPGELERLLAVASSS